MVDGPKHVIWLFSWFGAFLVISNVISNITYIFDLMMNFVIVDSLFYDSL